MDTSRHKKDTECLYSALQGGQALADGKLGQFRHAVDVQFFHDLVPVGFYGLDADMELSGDLFGEPAFSHQ